MFSLSNASRSAQFIEDTISRWLVDRHRLSVTEAEKRLRELMPKVPLRIKLENAKYDRFFFHSPTEQLYYRAKTIA